MTLFKWTGDNSHSFEFEAVGYQYKAEQLSEEADEDLEWVVIQVTGENQSAAWCHSDPCLCTYDLVSFRNWLCNVVKEPHEKKLWMARWEPYIEVYFMEASADWYHFAIVLHDMLSAHGGGQGATVLHLQVLENQHQLALRSLDAAIKRLPCRSDQGKAIAATGSDRLHVIQIG